MAKLGSTEIFGDLKVNADIVMGGGDIHVGEYSTIVDGSIFLHGYDANTTSEIKCTNGNLHIDCNSGDYLYLNYYNGAGVVIKDDLPLMFGGTSGEYTKIWHESAAGGTVYFQNFTDGHISLLPPAGHHVRISTIPSMGVSTYDVYSDSSGYVGKYSSSITLKRDIRDIVNVGLIIDNLRPRIFKWKEENSDKQYMNKDNYGFIAEEIATVIPEIIQYEPILSEDVREDCVGLDKKKIQGYESKALQAITIKAVQELRLRVKDLEAENSTLKQKLTAIESALASVPILKDLVVDGSVKAETTDLEQRILAIENAFATIPLLKNALGGV